MLIAATVLLVLTASLGTAQALMYGKGRQRPWALSLSHLALGTATLIVLGVALARREPFGLAGVGFLCLLAVALGGFILAGYHARGRRLPALLVVSHAAGAIVGLVLVLIDLLTVVQPGETTPL